MKRRTFISTAAISAAAPATGAARAADPVGAAPAAEDLSIPTSVFPRGDINPYGKFFTGESFLTMLSEPDDVWNCPIGNVTFKPGARTNWHKHSGGQILLVTAGLGRYCERGGRLRVITTTYMGATDVKAVEALRKLPNAEIRVSRPKSNTGTARTRGSAWCTSRSKPTSRTTRPSGLNP